MAHAVSFDLLDPMLESPVDENQVHSSFCQLINEQSHLEEQQTQELELEELEFEKELAEEELAEEGRDAVGYLPGPSAPLLEQPWSAATLKVLSAMPSRTIGRSRGAILSQYYNRTLQLRRRRSTRPALQDFSHAARPSIRGYRIETDSADENRRDQLVNNLQNLPASDRVRMLRAMPISLAEKSELRRLALSYKEGQTSLSGKIPCCSNLKYYIIIALRQGWYSWLSMLHSLQPWKMALKRVSGRFGTGVLSYFVFLRTLLLFNVLLLFINGFFLVIPQAVHPPPLTSTPVKFTGLELVTGAGCFSNSVMYYGYYTNSALMGSCQQNSTEPPSLLQCPPETFGLDYNMPLAYFFTVGIAFFITCIILVYSMSKSFGQSFRVDKPQGSLALKVFCSWDFRVIKKTSMKLQAENISTQLKELLSELSCREERRGLAQRLARHLVHLLAWLMCIGSTVACGLAVYYFSEYLHKKWVADHGPQELGSRGPLEEVSLLALPVVVSSFNLLLPGFFNTVAWMEQYDSPSVLTYVSIVRNLMLKVCLLVVLCYHWLGRIAAGPKELKLKCWESFVGQEMYRFLIMDFIFTMLDTFFLEFLWKIFSQKALKRKRKPVFDIARNVLELIYGQTLAWLGVLYAPLLPAVQLIKLLLLFYMKKVRRMCVWCMCVCLCVCVCVCVCLFMGLIMGSLPPRIKPSEQCGPFQNLTTMFQSGKLWVQQLEKQNPRLAWLAWVHTYLVENPLFLFVSAGIFLVVIYFHTQVVDGQRKIISLLQEQIENEGFDKKFLITRLQAIHEQKRPQQRPKATGSEGSDVDE
nr:transmembrane channel-like protein 6 [Paramormyrops kingsleyae]